MAGGGSLLKRVISLPGAQGGLDAPLAPRAAIA